MLKEKNLQNVPHTMTKVIQLFETKNSRHSTMIVGATQSGKTVSWKVLQAAMTKLNKEGDPNYLLVRVRFHPPWTRLSPDLRRLSSDNVNLRQIEFIQNPWHQWRFPSVLTQCVRSKWVEITERESILFYQLLYHYLQQPQTQFDEVNYFSEIVSVMVFVSRYPSISLQQYFVNLILPFSGVPLES